MLVLGLHREMKELKRQSLIVFQIILQDQFYKTTFLFYFFAALGKNTQNKKDIGR